MTYSTSSVIGLIILKTVTDTLSITSTEILPDAEKDPDDTLPYIGVTSEALYIDPIYCIDALDTEPVMFDEGAKDDTCPEYETDPLTTLPDKLITGATELIVPPNE